MKRLLNFAIIILIITSYGCEKESDLKYEYKAIVIGKGIDCDSTFLISMEGINQNSKFGNGIYYANQLSDDLKIEGQEIYLNCREQNENEIYPCTTLGPGYPHIVITKSERLNN